jgi:cyclomaltodextrinase
MAVPGWIKQAIFYQLFPDRFYNGDPNNDPPNVKPWNSLPTINGFHGGDIAGIIQKMDYLIDLGINTLYLTPIFLSPSTHGYNTSDYFKVDPKLGDLETFRRLIKIAHKHQIRIILDGVFNHCGRGFFAFCDVLENQSESPYVDWFNISRFPIDAYSSGDAKDYQGWWKHKSLPKLNTYNPKVRKYIFDVAKYWLEQGIDGWRLDVPNEIDDDGFWAEFRSVVKKQNSEAYLLGEIWNVDPRWVDESHFDGLMNYPMREVILQLLNERWTIEQCAERIQNIIRSYPQENINAMYNLLGSHDTERLRTLLGSLEKVNLAILILFSLPGAPAIYYGDEIGIEGGKDPDCRRAFLWNEKDWTGNIRRTTKTAIELRKAFNGLSTPFFECIFIDNAKKVFAYTRGEGKEKVMIVVNVGQKLETCIIPMHTLGWDQKKFLKDHQKGGQWKIENFRVSIDIEGLGFKLLY